MMNRFLCLCMLLFLLRGMALGADNQQEQLDVVGTVSAHDGAPLAGVSVTPLLFPNNRAATAADGQYQVRTSSNDTLLFTFVGYQQVQVAVDGRQRIDRKRPRLNSSH